MNMVASQSTISIHKSPAMTRKEMKRVARSHPGCTPFQQLVHSWVEPTWFLGIASTVRSLISGRATRRLWYKKLSSHFEARSLLHRTHKDTTKDAATMPKHTISYQYMTSAIDTPTWTFPTMQTLEIEMFEVKAEYHHHWLHLRTCLDGTEKLEGLMREC